jgi:2-amino-4-hydroxy-6-hydroxymethyldihydropteridine diphosphokinase
VSVAFVGIGSNLGDPVAAVRGAFDELARIPGTAVVKRSSLYRTAPLGYADQSDFVNAVAALETALEPAALLAELQAIEQRHGRERSFPNAARTLDLDLLLFGNSVLSTPSLTLPHPRMHERAFVLKPLYEVAPHASIPRVGTVKDCLEKTGAQKAERVA